ncbi:hypothetical protein SAMN05421743_12232 [Thalassobacillus cyri]|uniref:Uncharacterized protein n=1 Tax=Thalassobacillus cyri TaxID=571932 RepID=A0A1H4H407_9BACI|nr:hypothetical protein SAMN05421743_12232 [Thalassobacillus cyri]
MVVDNGILMKMRNSLTKEDCAFFSENKKVDTFSIHTVYSILNLNSDYYYWNNYIRVCDACFYK